jgi:hypothetical protein
MREVLMSLQHFDKYAGGQGGREGLSLTANVARKLPPGQ